VPCLPRSSNVGVQLNTMLILRLLTFHFHFYFTDRRDFAHGRENQRTVCNGR